MIFDFNICEKCWELRFWRPSLNKNIYILQACIYDKICFVQDAKGFFSLLSFNCLRDVGVRTVGAPKSKQRSKAEGSISPQTTVVTHVSSQNSYHCIQVWID